MQHLLCVFVCVGDSLCVCVWCVCVWCVSRAPVWRGHVTGQEAVSRKQNHVGHLTLSSSVYLSSVLLRSSLLCSSLFRSSLLCSPVLLSLVLSLPVVFLKCYRPIKHRGILSDRRSLSRFRVNLSCRYKRHPLGGAAGFNFNHNEDFC